MASCLRWSGSVPILLIWLYADSVDLSLCRFCWLDSMPILLICLCRFSWFVLVPTADLARRQFCWFVLVPTVDLARRRICWFVSVPILLICLVANFVHFQTSKSNERPQICAWHELIQQIAFYNWHQGTDWLILVPFARVFSLYSVSWFPNENMHSLQICPKRYPFKVLITSCHLWCRL